MQNFDLDTCERIFHAALAAGDFKGVEAALTVMAPQDPHRAELLFNTLKVGLAIARLRTQAERHTDGTTWRATCCALHGIPCEPPADLCCHDCTEAVHPDHRPGERCVLPGAINDRYTRRNP